MTMELELNETIQAQLDRIERLTLIGAKNTLDINEAAIYTNRSVGYLYRLTSGREIPHFKQAGKLYFKKSELDEWMTEERVLTNEQLNREADRYLMK